MTRWSAVVLGAAAVLVCAGGLAVPSYADPPPSSGPSVSSSLVPAPTASSSPSSSVSWEASAQSSTSGPTGPVPASADATETVTATVTAIPTSTSGVATDPDWLEARDTVVVAACLVVGMTAAAVVGGWRR